MTETTAAAQPGFYDTLMLTDRAACARAIRWGGIAATVNAVWAAAFAGYVLLKAPSANGLLLLGGAALVAVLAFFVFRRSRVAATVLLLHFVTTKVVFWANTGATAGLATGVVFIVFYFIAMRATYVWHARYENAPA